MWLQYLPLQTIVSHSWCRRRRRSARPTHNKRIIISWLRYFARWLRFDFVFIRGLAMQTAAPELMDLDDIYSGLIN